MIIISDCVKDNLDEGCIKVASTLSKRLVAAGAKLIAVNCDCSYSTVSISEDKAYMGKTLYQQLKKYDGDILYIPEASNTLGTAIRLLNLSVRTRKKINVLFVMRWDMNFVTKYLIKKSGCNIWTLSSLSYEFFNEQISGASIDNILTGVDSSRFIPVDEERKKKLREKYGFPLDKQIVLHVGHLKHSRNIDAFLGISDKYHSVLVFSSVTEQDQELKNELLLRKNITIIEDYCPKIEELYQAADIYVFPVIKENNCIDVPLSVLEAASCNMRIVASAYNEINSFEKKRGLLVIDEFDNDKIEEYIDACCAVSQIETREIAEKYDWNNAVSFIMDSIR